MNKTKSESMNQTLEVKLPPSRPMSIPSHEDLMRQHLRDENLPEAVMPACPINKVLRGQKALVTGANSGIGQAVALALAHAGADVVINYVSRPDAAEAVVKEAMRCGASVYAHQADVRKEDQVQAMFKKMIQEFGTIDILVNNAGLQKDARIEDMTLADWQFVLDVNLTGQFLCSREAIREFKRRGVRKEVSCAAGKIICMSSVHEVAPHSIRVNSVCPGAVRTPINMEAWGTPEAYRELMKLIPYKRIGEPDDIGRAAVWLASDDSDYIHGASIFVDGGMTLYPGFETGG